jgi:hypothetical protein
MDGYPIALIIHLFCAIIFIGYVFSDVMVYPVIKQVLDEETQAKVKETISNRARKIFPLSVLFLVLSGGFMFSKYINSEDGFANTNLQIILLIKVFLALIIVSGIVYSLSRRLLNKKSNPLMAHFHNLVLILGAIIIILAKLMFVF